MQCVSIAVYCLDFSHIMLISDTEQYVLACKNSVVRLVSSGWFYNSVTFSFRRLDEYELTASDMEVCTSI